MAFYGSDDLIIVFDSSGGTTVNVTQSVQSINGVDLEAIMEETHTFGDAWVENMFTGLRRANEITITGLYDDAASTGSNAMFNDPGNQLTASSASRTLQVTWGGGKTSTVETFIKTFKRTPSRGALTQFECVLVPTGALTEA